MAKKSNGAELCVFCLSFNTSDFFEFLPDKYVGRGANLLNTRRCQGCWLLAVIISVEYEVMGDALSYASRVRNDPAIRFCDLYEQFYRLTQPI